MKYLKNEEYLKLTNDILKNEDIKKMSTIKHHHTNRLDHSIKVSYISYRIAKFLKLNYKETARGGLLHDFFHETTTDFSKTKDKIRVFTKHSYDAQINAEKQFELTKKEKDMIKSHMFPLNLAIPKYKESWIVNTVDTSISLYEFSLKFKPQIISAANLFVLFLMNYIN